MPAQNKKCRHCGHINLRRAVYCFQCGRVVGSESPESDSSVSRRSQRIVQALWQPETPSVKQKLSSTALLKDLHLEEPLTCLSCGSLNRPDARFCTACGTPLIVPDHEAHLLARASARTDVGRVRDNNEDSIGLWAMRGVLLALVADGMGGAVAGEEASRLTVEAVQADFVGERRVGYELLTLAEEVITEKLASAIQAANLAVIDRVDEDAALRGMGTTSTLAYIHGRRVIIAHVGDSRAYLVDKGQGWINQITSDHSFVEALLVAGHITEEQAADHPMKNVLYRALGQTPDTTADVYDRYLKDGDRIVLCSDGLTRHVTPDEIAQLVLQDDNPDAATQRLIDLANERGGEDNISIIVIQMSVSLDTTTEMKGLSALMTPSSSDTVEISDLPEPIPTEPDDAEPALIASSAGDAESVRQRERTETQIADDFFQDDVSDSLYDAATQKSRPQEQVSQAFRMDAEDDRNAIAPYSGDPDG